MISPPSIESLVISEAPTPLLRISAWPTALSPSSSVPTALAARSAAVSVESATAPLSTLACASERAVTAPSPSLASVIEPAGVRVSARRALAERSAASSERSFTCFDVIVPFWMSLPLSSRCASAGPPSATNSASPAITSEIEGRRLREGDAGMRRHHMRVARARVRR